MPEQQKTRDELAIAASIRDMSDGKKGRPFEEFAREFRRKNFSNSIADSDETPPTSNEN